VRPATGRQDGAACSVYIRDAVCIGSARPGFLLSVPYPQNFFEQNFILWATRASSSFLSILSFLLFLPFLISFHFPRILFHIIVKELASYSSACIYRNGRMRETSRLLIPTFAVSSNLWPTTLFFFFHFILLLPFHSKCYL
jgi:hypothetical protein